MSAPTSGSIMTLDKLLQGYAPGAELSDIPVYGISGNSKSIKIGDLFIAQTGLTSHAIDFSADAVKSGAVAVAYDADDAYCHQRISLLSKQFETKWIPVANLQLVIGEIASRFYGHPSQYLKLVAVTGTDGKTSVVHLLIQALNKLNKKAGSIGTLGYGIANHLKITRFTTPDAITLQSILFELTNKGCDVVVMEVSSHALEQFRVKGCHFDIAVLTNLGSDHLDYHGKQVQYEAAKSRLFAWPDLSGFVLNIDDGYGQRLYRLYKGNKVTAYSSGRLDVHLSADQTDHVYLDSSEMTAQGLKINVSTKKGSMQIQTGLIGLFNIDNLLACISVLLQLGFDAEEIENSMQDLQPIPGRMEYYPSLDHRPSVVIDFAHTEQALTACLKSVKGLNDGNLFCVFGCGGDRDQSKRPKMAAAAERIADRIILTEDNPRYESTQAIMQDILSGFERPQRVQVIHDRHTAIETAIRQAMPGDLVVIAGKGHEQIQVVGDQRIPFSDRYVVKKILSGDS